MTPFPLFRLTPLVLVAGVLVLPSCAPRQPPRHATAVAEATCRQRADQIYLKRNRDAVYAQDRYASSTRDAPFATSGTTGVTTQGLSGRFERDQLYDDCLNSATQVGPRPAAPSTP